MKKDSVLLKIWRIIYPILTHIGISYIVSILAVLLLLLKVVLSMDWNIANILEIAETMTDEVFAYAMIMTLVSGAVVTPIFYVFYKADIKRMGFREVFEKPSLSAYVGLILLAVISCFVFNNIITMTNISEIFPGFEEIAEVLYGGNIIIQILTVVVMAPIMEETLFRGLIQKRLCEDMKPTYGILVSAFLFGVYHMNVVQGIYAFAIGLLLGYSLEKYKTLAAPIIFHMVANGISVLMVETIIFDFLYINDKLIIFTTIIEVILLIILILWIHKKVKLERIKKIFTNEKNHSIV